MYIRWFSWLSQGNLWFLFPTEKVDTFLNGFFGDRRIKKAAHQHGINGKKSHFDLLVLHLRNGKHALCFYWVIETQGEV